MSQEVLEGKAEVQSIPERRPDPEERARLAAERAERPTAGALTVWRCQVCGYLCAREKPPAVCPICKAQRERFEIFHFTDGG